MAKEKKQNENQNAKGSRYSKKSAKVQNEKKKTAPKKNEQPKKNAPKKNYQKKNESTKAVKNPLKIIPLGGLGEIGKNITVYEYKDDILLVDCGMAFPDEETPGVDIIIPDFTYLVKNKDRIKGLVVTHGHEDHIGAIPYLLSNVKIPIYATRLTIGLIDGKLKEHKNLGSVELNTVEPGQIIQLGVFGVEFIHVNHSIPDAVAFAIKTPAGVIVHTGDFKIDTTPIDDRIMDLARFGELGKKGVLAMLADSTNAERPGYTMSERVVGESFQNLFKKAGRNRIIVATFSSNIHRIQQIIDAAVSFGRKVAVSGRSMLNVVSVAEKLGYLNVPDNVLIDIESIKKYLPEQLVIITTGSQGEPLSALHRMAFSDHRQVEIVPDDLIIISATPIPGNEKLVSKVVNELMRRGANVVYEKMYDVHVSGHACQEELKLLMSLVKPEYYIPLHGEQKHLYKHALLARTMGIPKEKTLIANIGDVIELSKKGIKVSETVTAGRVLVDGLGVGDVGGVVLRDRKALADSGIIIVTVTMDSANGEVVAGPEIVTRGFVYVKESEQLIAEVTEVAEDILENCYIHRIRDWNTIKIKLRDGISKHLYSTTRRSPMVLPIIMEI